MPPQPNPSAPSVAAFTAKSSPPQKQLVLRSAAQVRQAASLGKGGATQAFTAIWDTGASSTCISPKISQALGLGAISMATIHAVGSSYDAPVCKIDVILPNGLVVVDVRAVEVRNIQGADMLIGMDIITTGDLAITNADNDTWFSFRFPSARQHIDYADEASRINRSQAQTSDRQRMIKNLKRKGKLR
jgi:hypothetical protein